MILTLQPVWPPQSRQPAAAAPQSSTWGQGRNPDKVNFSIFIFSPFNLISFFFLGKKNETHIKKPLNAFMLYMKEMRPVVQAECTLKESAAINQLLGRRVRQQVWIFFNLESLIPLFRLYVKVLFDAFMEFVYFLQFARQFFLKLSWETGLVWEIKTKVKKLICLAVARSKSGRTSQVLREGSSGAAKAHANVSPLERSWQLPIWLQKEEAETGEVGGDCLS